MCRNTTVRIRFLRPTTMLAMGWRHYFVAIPMPYVYSDLSILEQTIETFSRQVLIDRTFDLSHPDRHVEFFIGGTYLDVTQDLTNSIVLPLSDADPSLADAEIAYKIHEINVDQWNYVVGGQYQFNKNWSIVGQIGFGGSRDQFTRNRTWRF